MSNPYFVLSIPGHRVQKLIIQRVAELEKEIVTARAEEEAVLRMARLQPLNFRGAARLDAQRQSLVLIHDLINSMEIYNFTLVDLARLDLIDITSPL
jgi:hypothetical protein